MKLWKVATASGPAYVQAKDEAAAMAIAEEKYGKGNVTGAGQARGSGDILQGAAILAKVKDIGVIQVGTYNGGGNLNSLSNFAESYDPAQFANNLAQNPYYSPSGPNVGGGGGSKNNYAPLGDGSGGFFRLSLETSLGEPGLIRIAPLVGRRRTYKTRYRICWTLRVLRTSILLFPVKPPLSRELKHSLSKEVFRVLGRELQILSSSLPESDK